MITALSLLAMLLILWLFFTQPIWAPLLAALALALGGSAFEILRRRLGLWRERAPHAEPLIFLNAKMAVRPTVLGHPTPEGYRLACLYFGVGLLDRTGVLDHGFAHQTLDPIPKSAADPGPIAALCAARAQTLAEEARRSDKTLRLLWSGGIDSTAAATALLRALRDEPERLEFVYTAASIREYRRFHRRFIRAHPRHRRINSIHQAFEGDALLVTGEHGDQLFGSAKAMDLPFAALGAPWESAFPDVLRRAFGSPERAEAALRYLEPQFAAAPIPLTTLFDLLWWMNFSLKWQAVSQRIAANAPRNRYQEIDARMRHFFRAPAFERWALANPDKRIKNSWTSYKWPLREVIYDFTEDRRYVSRKLKEPSLRQPMRGAHLGRALAIDASGAALLQLYDKTLRTDDAISVEISLSAERPLWDAVDGDGGE